MANEIQVLPQADPQLLSILQLAHQTHRSFTQWRETHPNDLFFRSHWEDPNDLFFRSHWEDIDDIDSGLIDIKCEIAALIGNDLVDHLQ